MGYMNYEERLEVAKRLYELSNAEQKTALECIFPELCESEDEKTRKELIEFVKSRGGFKQEYIAWLEKQGEQKPAWSNEVMIANIRDDLFCYQTKVRDEDHQLAEDIEKEINWLRTIKPQNKWKPSDEQMRALNSTAGIVGILTPTGVTLCSLYKDLEKLKRE